MKEEIFSKRCPKCGGNLYFERDYYHEGMFVNWYEQQICLQCGFTCGRESRDAARAGGVKDTAPKVKQLVTA